MSAPQPVLLGRLTPAAEDGWHLLFDLAEVDDANWVLIGGQLVQLLAVENGVQPVRATDDVDVLVNLRTKPGGTAWLAQWLVDHDFGLKSISTDGIGHRFEKPASGGVGTVVFDILAPDGIGERASRTTVPPARTVEAPGGTQALNRSGLVVVTVSGDTGRPPRTGLVRRPSVLGALVAKAAATTLAVRVNPERDWEDAALLLCLVDDPLAAREDCSAKDLKRLRRLTALADVGHPAWAVHSAERAQRGRDALGFLVD